MTIDLVRFTLLDLFATAGIESITKANAKAFWKQIDSWQNRYGPFLEKRLLTEADVKANIGLKKG